MALLDRKAVLGATLAGVAAVGFAASPVQADEQNNAPAQLTQTSATTVSATTQIVDDAGLVAGRYSRENPGVAVAIYLGTHSSTPSRERIVEALTADFREAGLSDPVTFFFEQNDVPGSVASFHYDGAIDGPFRLGDSRSQTASTAKSYNFRKDRGLLASLDPR
ncbi:hypothetical protein [uncultured Erythrobacter sp.]|uniref:hypothetical protein n=1 Tax=uncultured Erythrobacter sp. TaxID=263913 RepID=UPI00262A2A75|nr:hypothetical protein [uncultured Erythrobacter sp.]